MKFKFDTFLLRRSRYPVCMARISVYWSVFDLYLCCNRLRVPKRRQPTSSTRRVKSQKPRNIIAITMKAWRYLGLHYIKEIRLGSVTKHVCLDCLMSVWPAVECSVTLVRPCCTDGQCASDIRTVPAFRLRIERADGRSYSRGVAD